MNSKTHQIKIVKSKIAPLITAALAFVSILCCYTTQAQTLQLRYAFADGPGTTTTNDPTSAIYPIVLNMFNSSGGPVDLHGAANSGPQNQGGSLNVITNPLAGNVNGAFAVTSNNLPLGTALGIVSDFTATIWFKMPNLFTNLNNQGPRLWVLAPTAATDLNAATTIGLQFGSRNALSQAPTPLDDLNGFVGATRISPPIYYDFPTNVWIFCAVVYDSASGNGYMYYGTEASPAKLVVAKSVPLGTTFNFSGGANLSIGNKINNARDFAGSISDFRFYTGVGSPAFIEGIRQAALPVKISNLSPDGTVLQAGTNLLTFTAISANGIQANNVKVAVNGLDVSANLQFSGPATALNVSYTNLPVNPTLISQSSLNGVGVSIKVTDDAGVVTTNSYVYDAFSPTNFTWEVEDFDFGGGLFIDNPVISFVGPAANTYYQEQTPYVQFVDADDNASTAGPSRVYRDPSYPVETEFAVGNGIDGGNSIGELMRQKVLDAFAVTNAARDVNVGYFDGGTGAGLPNWMNYTRTFPNGNYNVWLRAADGAGALAPTLSSVVSGWGIPNGEVLTNVGTFNMANSGGWKSFSWVPLRDSSGNLVQVKLNGTNTFRLTAGSGGGGNDDFFMLTTANTNLPTINNVYPNGTNMFQPSPTFSFTASSLTGAAINQTGVKVRLTITNLLGIGFATNLTSTNGLTFSGPVTNLFVSTPLTSNNLYTATISVVDANGSPAGTSATFDTLSPAYTWEAPDYDYSGGLALPDPIAVDGYVGLPGASQIDYNFANTTPPPANNYRDSNIVGVENNSDHPLRLQYLTNSPTPQPYDVGYYNGGNWLNYTRTFPAGDYNMYIRAADGSTASGNIGVSVVTNAAIPQTGTNVGSFTISPTGDWQAYTWTPLRDSSGNLVKFVGGSTQTLKATSAGSQNVFFYALFPANTNLPTLKNVFPVSGTQLTNTFSFGVQSTAGVASNSVVVTVNGVTVPLIFSGTINNWTVTYPHLLPYTPYVITVTVTDLNGNSSSTTSTFDTINPNNYTWEAEDFDNNGTFVADPQTNAYIGMGAVTGVDTVQTNFASGGTDLYRSSGMFTEVTGDIPRPRYQDVNNPQTDYTMGYFSDGAWANYTRYYPTGAYNVYLRGATASATGTDATLALVTSGWGTPTQTTNILGQFNVPNTGGWETYQFVPLRDSAGNLAVVNFNGSTNTLQLGRPYDQPTTSADVNVNFLMLVPAFVATASQNGANTVITFPTTSGWNYQVQYKTNLTDATWISVGSPVSGNSGNRSVSDATGGKSRFYRVQIQ